MSQQVDAEGGYGEFQGSSDPESGPQPTWRRRVLLRTNRPFITSALVASAFLVVFGLGRLDVLGVTSRSTMSSLFSGVITGVFTLTSVVLTINQLVLSRVIGSPDELEAQMDGTIEFRRRVERAVGVSASPIEPGAFVLSIANALCEHAIRLRETVTTTAEADERVREDCVAYADTVAKQTESLADALDRDGLDTFDVLKSTAYTHFAEDIKTGYRLTEAYDDRMADATADVLGEPLDLLECVTIARQYVKTLYIQQDLARLSRHVLYTGITGLAVVVVSTLLYARSGGPPVEPDGSLLVVSVALALAMLFSHAIQFAMIAIMTESAGPFTPRKNARAVERPRPVGWPLSERPVEPVVGTMKLKNW